MINNTKETVGVITSFRKGYIFSFYDEGNEIILNAKMTGREIVYFNDDIIVNKLKLTVKSVHHFNKNERDYELEIKVTNHFTGRATCSLKKNGIEIERQHLKISPKMIVKVLVLGVVAGFALGFVISYLLKLVGL